MKKETIDYSELYVHFLKKHISLKRPLTVVADASNGTAGLVLTKLQGIQNLNLILLNDTPNGDFPAHGPNPLNPGATDDAAKKVREIKADIGVIFDADADRSFFVNEKGELIPAFYIAALLFKHGIPPFVAEELVYKCLEHMGLLMDLIVYPSRVGSYFVKEKLMSIDGTIGAEYSGHYYFKEFFGADSGIFTMIKVLNLLSSNSQTISELCSELPSHSTKNIDVKLGDKKWRDVEQKIRDHYANTKVKFETREGLTIDYGDKWINIRPSNTEPLIRLFAGSKSESVADSLLSEIQSLV